MHCFSASGRWDLILQTRIFAKAGVAGFSNGFACLLNRALQSIHRDKWRFCSQSGALQTSAYCLIHLGQYNSPCSLKERLLFRLLMKFHYIALKEFQVQVYVLKARHSQIARFINCTRLVSLVPCNRPQWYALKPERPSNRENLKKNDQT